MPAKWAVRRAKEIDLEGVLEVHVQQGNRPASPPSPLEIRTWARMLTNPDLSVYVTDTHDGIVGTATTMMMPNITYHCAPTLFIEAVVVTPTYRRNGIATAMLRTALDEASAAGCNKVQLLSHKRHATDGAHTLYLSLGFTPEAEGFRYYLQQ